MHDTIIIGAGIAGITAAIYASRKRMRYEIVSSDFGGQFLASGEVLNYPGIVSTTGAEFSQKMEEQMRFNNVNLRYETVQKILRKGKDFIVHTDANEYETRTVLIASGSSPRRLGIPGEKELANKGITYCSICDGPLFSGMDIAVIGGGNSALEAVDFMKDIAKSIHVLVIDKQFTGHEYLVEKVMKNPKVSSVLFGARTVEIKGDKFVNGLKFEQDGDVKELAVQGVIIEAGRLPNTDFVKDLVVVDDHGHIIIDCQGRTSVPGVFAAGDCASGHEYQYVISAGQGCMALIKAARYIAERKI